MTFLVGVLCVNATHSKCNNKTCNMNKKRIHEPYLDAFKYPFFFLFSYPFWYYSCSMVVIVYVFVSLFFNNYFMVAYVQTDTTQHKTTHYTYQLDINSIIFIDLEWYNGTKEQCYKYAFYGEWKFPFNPKCKSNYKENSLPKAKITLFIWFQYTHTYDISLNYQLCLLMDG